MKNSRLLSLFLLIICVGLSASAAGNFIKPSFFTSNSALASGKWVKVGVEETGLYEIPYQRLREMGFTNPEKVGVFGHGGAMMSTDFTDANGNPLIDNDLKEVSVLHYDDKLIFFGVGVDSFSLKIDEATELGARFVRNGRNIYSRLGYYFLTEVSGTPREMQRVTSTQAPARTIREGFGMIYHEKDSMQNNTNTGQFFWGEKFNDGFPSMHKWKYELTDAIIDNKVALECSFYVTRGSVGQLEYGIVGAPDNVSFTTRDYNTTDFRRQTPDVGDITLQNRRGEIFVKYTEEDNDDYANLDYWLLSYVRQIPSLINMAGETMSQDAISFMPLGEDTQWGRITLPGGLTHMAIDVTDATDPKLLETIPSGLDGVVFFESDNRITDLIIFDPTRTLHTIKGFDNGYSFTPNQNLHARAEKGATMLIITTPQFKEYGERLADLHRKHDGIGVMVASCDEIYNEFSSGVPDPMAYRSLAKMLYLSTKEKLRNILLLGPLYADMRGITVDKDPLGGLIAYQNTEISEGKGAHNVNDFYGMMDDHIGSTYLEHCNVHVGVGILPVHFNSEAERMIKKIEDYLTDEDRAYFLNEMLNIGGVGDNHSHDFQAQEIGNFVSVGNSNHMVTSTLCIDAYGAEQARKKMFEYFNTGKNLVTYFGHGGISMMGKDTRFFGGDHVSQFTNTHLPFMVFAGCVLTNTDRGQRGIGESMVTAIPNGLIGSLASTRDTWSGQNLDFVKIFYNRMFKDGASINAPRLSKPLTIGEIFARSKTQSVYNNEMGYQLICDPELKIPVAHSRIKITLSSDNVVTGQNLGVTGNILDPDGLNDKTFNGKVVVKLFEPPVKIKSPDFETKGQNEGEELTVEYSDYLATLGEGIVKDGKFEVTIPISHNLDQHDGKSTYLYATAYDPSTQLGASSRAIVDIKKGASTDPTLKDTQAPVIESFYFDADSETIKIVVSDDVALDLRRTPLANGFHMAIDGKSYLQGSNAMAILEDGVRRYRKSVAVGHLSKGTHSCRIDVYDEAGNVTRNEIVFSTDVPSRRLEISLDDTAVENEANFKFAGHQQNVVINIADHSGNIIYTSAASGSGFKWNRLDSEGNRVPAGLYKAWIMEIGSGNDKSHSDFIYVPVL